MLSQHSNAKCSPALVQLGRPHHTRTRFNILNLPFRKSCQLIYIVYFKIYLVNNYYSLRKSLASLLKPLKYEQFFPQLCQQTATFPYKISLSAHLIWSYQVTKSLSKYNTLLMEFPTMSLFFLVGAYTKDSATSGLLVQKLACQYCAQRLVCSLGIHNVTLCYKYSQGQMNHFMDYLLMFNWLLNETTCLIRHDSFSTS